MERRWMVLSLIGPVLSLGFLFLLPILQAPLQSPFGEQVDGIVVAAAIPTAQFDKGEEIPLTLIVKNVGTEPRRVIIPADDWFSPSRYRFSHRSESRADRWRTELDVLASKPSRWIDIRSFSSCCWRLRPPPTRLLEPGEQVAWTARVRAPNREGEYAISLYGHASVDSYLTTHEMNLRTGTVRFRVGEFDLSRAVEAAGNRFDLPGF